MVLRETDENHGLIGEIGHGQSRVFGCVLRRFWLESLMTAGKSMGGEGQRED